MEKFYAFSVWSDYTDGSVSADFNDWRAQTPMLQPVRSDRSLEVRAIGLFYQRSGARTFLRTQVIIWTLAPVLVLELSGSQALCQDGFALPRASRDGYSFGVGLYNFSEQWTYGNQVDNMMFYFEGSRAIFDHAELYGRVGWSNIVINEGIRIRPNPEIGDLSPNTFTPFFAGGVRAELFSSGRLAIGASASATVYSEFTDYVNDVDNGGNVYYVARVQAISEYNFNLTAAWRGNHALFYAGPTVHFGYIDGVVETNEVLPTGKNLVRHNLIIRDKGSIATIVGVVFPILDRPIVAEARIGKSVSGGLSVFWSW